MIDRLIDDLEWPGRRVRGDSKTDDAGAEDSKEPAGTESPTPKLIEGQRAEQIRQKLDRSRESVNQLEEEAARQLDEVLDMPTSGLPQTQEAVSYFDGSHPDFGTEFPDVPEREKLATNGRITGEVFRRAYDAMENADMLAYGVDLEEAIFEDEVRPYNPVKSPLQAAGRVSPGRRESMSLPQAFETSEKEKKLAMWKVLAMAVGGFLLKIVANIVRSIGDTAANALSVRIAGKKFGIGKWIAKPLYWFADMLDDIAESLLSKALGHDPADREFPERERGVSFDENDQDLDTSSLPADGSLPEALQQKADEYPQQMFDQPNAAGEKGAGGGQKFLMAAQRVVQSTADEAVRRDNPQLSRALSLYDKARILQRDLDAQNSIATAWGVPAPAENDTPEDARSSMQPESDVAPATEQDSFEDC